MQHRLFVNNISTTVVQQVCNGKFRKPKFRTHGGCVRAFGFSPNRSSQKVYAVGGGFVRPLPPMAPVPVRSRSRVKRCGSTDRLRRNENPRRGRIGLRRGFGVLVRFSRCSLLSRLRLSPFPRLRLCSDSREVKQPFRTISGAPFHPSSAARIRAGRSRQASRGSQAVLSLGGARRTPRDQGYGRPFRLR